MRTVGGLKCGVQKLAVIAPLVDTIVGRDDVFGGFGHSGRSALHAIPLTKLAFT